MNSFVILVVAVLLVALLGLVVALRRSSVARRIAENDAREVRETSSRKFRRLEQDLIFLREFFQVFASLLAKMHAARKVRLIPQALLEAIVRIYRPEEAAVFVWRGPKGSDRL